MTIEEQEAIYKEIDEELQLNAILNTVERKGIEKGIEQGETRKGKAIARKLKQLSIPLEVVSSATGLSVEELETLKN